MTAIEMMLTAIKTKGYTNAKVCELMGWFPQQLSQRICRNSIKADELLKILELIGVDVKMYDKKTGKEIVGYSSGAGRSARGMVAGVKYSTANSLALANNFYADGVNMFSDGRARELYIDMNGNYFFVEYTEIPGEKDRINPISARDAADFISIYGTEIHKEPKA